MLQSPNVLIILSWLSVDTLPPGLSSSRFFNWIKSWTWKAEPKNVTIGFETKLGFESQSYHVIAVRHWTVLRTVLSIRPQTWNEIANTCYNTYNTCYRFVTGKKWENSCQALSIVLGLESVPVNGSYGIVMVNNNYIKIIVRHCALPEFSLNSQNHPVKSI